MHTAQKGANCKGSILLVDDDETVLEVSAMMIRKLGYSVLEARDGLEAIEVFKKLKDEVNLVILDMRMPRMNGIITFGHLKKISSNVKILISSGYMDDRRIRNIFKNGCDGFIEKPYSLTELSAKIKEILAS
jgi:CheY-like chemotaxis protein